ncbi:MAG: putative toxin-antitoxin system toxin component, PIN family [Verrucomicrobiota bacterium]|nr:putative toxin-antitoxin system toxin component, PIN family [Verrucomicrobiota bacterium]
MRVVLDTNIVFAALAASGFCHEVFRRVARANAVVTSEPLLNELDDILKRKLRITPAVTSFVTELRRRAVVVKPAPLTAQICRDRNDDVVLATAVAAQAEVIVTGDSDLLVLKEYQGIRILSPRQFLELLDRTAHSR